jgi:oligoendopeptidase F
MNAASQMSDLTTMVHEAGHAVHSFLAHPLELTAFKEYPTEMAEVASMSMELFTMDHWDMFFESEEDMKRAKRHQLERVITIFPWIATIDAFQHWIYEHPNHTMEERKDNWLRILNTYSTSAIDYTGLEPYRSYSWQRQLHLFEVPFYYIEYGIAQLGAIGMWKQYREDPKNALNRYINGLSLGGTKRLPELYQSSGIQFDFSHENIRSLMLFVKNELDSL